MRVRSSTRLSLLESAFYEENKLSRNSLCNCSSVPLLPAAYVQVLSSRTVLRHPQSTFSPHAEAKSPLCGVSATLQGRLFLSARCGYVWLWTGLHCFILTQADGISGWLMCKIFAGIMTAETPALTGKGSRVRSCCRPHHPRGVSALLSCIATLFCVN
jgi:hypothetical protein